MNRKQMVLIFFVLRVWSTLGAMEPVSQKDITLILKNGQESLAEGDWQSLKELTSISELLRVEDGKVSLPGLTKEGLALMRNHMILIQEGGKSLEDLFDSYMSHNKAQEYIDLLMAGDYLGIDSILSAFYAVLDVRVAHYLMGQNMTLKKDLWNNAFGFAPKKLAERIFLCAAEKGNAQIVELFVNDATIEVDVQDQKGITPLMHASRKGHTHIVNLFDLHKHY